MEAWNRTSGPHIMFLETCAHAKQNTVEHQRTEKEHAPRGHSCDCPAVRLRRSASCWGSGVCRC